jgi:hypothetical protein
MNLRSVVVLSACTLVALGAPVGALAAPTASQITSPASPAAVTYDQENPGSFHVAGTTSGGTGNVDLRCYWGASSALVASALTVTNGAFAADVPLTGAQFAALDSNYCVLRAVPAGTTPPAPPGQPSPFEGPETGWGGTTQNRLGPAGAPNPADTLYDYRWHRVQKRAYNGYYSAGDCGLCETSLFDPTTFANSHQIWYQGAALWSVEPTKGVPTQSAVQVDGVDVYNPAGARAGFSHVLQNNPGFPALAYASSVDPITGDLTIIETDPFVSCSPQPAVYPPSDLTCSAFAPPVVTLERKIVQDHQGLKVTISDNWRSNDGLPHQLDARYAEGTASDNYALQGHETRYDFSWTGAGFTAYADGTDIAPPPSAPASVYVKTDATTPESGDGTNPFGAVTYRTTPSSIRVLDGSASPTNGYDTWFARYQRTIPASGDLVIEQVYSHDYSLTGVRAIEADTGQAPPAAGDLTTPAAPVDATVTPAPTTVAASTPASAPVKCKVPKLRGRTLPAAKRLLRHNHCRLGKVTRKASARMRPGRVLASTPRAGSRRASGARIAVRIASARTTLSAPGRS